MPLLYKGAPKCITPGLKVSMPFAVPWKPVPKAALLGG